MATKKYALKSNIERYDDGTNNDEHIKDIISQIEMLYQNIQDNNDLCMQLYKFRQAQNTDEDLLDATQIACENALQFEREASTVFAVIEKAKTNIKKYDKSHEADFNSLYKQMQELEKKSRKNMEKVI